MIGYGIEILNREVHQYEPRLRAMTDSPPRKTMNGFKHTLASRDAPVEIPTDNLKESQQLEHVSTKSESNEPRMEVAPILGTPPPPFT
jgi:hypothetical protein